MDRRTSTSVGLIFSKWFYYLAIQVTGGNPAIADAFSTPKGQPNPLTGCMFLLETTNDIQPAPKYTYDECLGSLFEVGSNSEISLLVQQLGHAMATLNMLKYPGDLTISDETGQTVHLLPGDTFFIRRRSTISFTTIDTLLLTSALPGTRSTHDYSTLSNKTETNTLSKL